MCRAARDSETGSRVEPVDVDHVPAARPRWEGTLPVAALAGPRKCTPTFRRRFNDSPTVYSDWRRSRSEGSTRPGRALRVRVSDSDSPPAGVTPGWSDSPCPRAAPETVRTNLRPQQSTQVCPPRAAAGVLTGARRCGPSRPMLLCDCALERVAVRVPRVSRTCKP